MGGWKLLINDDGSGLELCDMGTDTTEQNNLAATNGEVAERLSEKLLGWRRSLPSL